MDTIVIDTRLALRRLRTHRGFALTVVAIVGLGVAAATVMFSIVDAVLLAPLPYPSAERIHQVRERQVATGEETKLAYPTYVDLRASAEAFERLGAARFANYNLTGGAEPKQLRVARIDAAFFEIFGAQPLLGRLFDDEEHRTAGRVAVVGHALWHNQLGGDESVLGHTITLDGEPYEVIGVLPATFDRPDYAEMWLPLGALTAHGRDRRELDVFGRLAARVDVERARAELAAFGDQLAREHAATHEGRTLTLESLHTATVGANRDTLWALFAAVSALLLIVAANVAGLQLARGVERRAELAVRTALGAGRARVVRQLLVENVVMALAGGAVGVLLSVWLLDVVLGLAPDSVPRLAAAQVDARAVFFAVAVSLVAALIFGLLPAIRATSTALFTTLRSAAAGGGGGQREGWRPTMVVAQVALSLVLLIGAGLLGRSFQALMAVDLGFEAETLVTVGFVLPPDRYPEGHTKTAWLAAVRAQVARVPGVEAVTSVNWPLLGPSRSRVGMTPVRGVGDGNPEPVDVDVRVVGPTFFETVGLPLRAGRTFDDRDRADSVATAVVTETVARRVWGAANPLGERVRYTERGVEVTAEVVGVVGDARLSGPTAALEAGVFRPYAQEPWSYSNLIIRQRAGDATEVLGAVQRAIWSVDPDRPLFATGGLDQWLDTLRGRPRFSALLSAALSLFALVLAAVGLYGMMAFAVHGRRREIGIRMALGARVADVRRMIVHRGMALAGVGVALGLVGGWITSRWLQSQLFEVAPLDPLTIGTVVAILLGATYLASYGPAVRASRVDPAYTLRRE